MRSHQNSENFKNSTGFNGHYNAVEYKKRLKQSLVDVWDSKLGTQKKFEVNCAKCSKSFNIIEREKSFPSKNKYFCSRECANSHVVTTEHRRKVSEALSGRKYTEPKLVEKTCLKCGTIFTVQQIGPKLGRDCCSRSCATSYYNAKRHAEKRKTRSDLINYRSDCAFKFTLSDYPDEFDFSLIETYGWYKPKNRGDNLTGVSRDHAVSVRYGFDNKLPAEHLAHPANCVLMQHGKNVSKNVKNSMTYEELLNRIEAWNKKYRRV